MGSFSFISQFRRLIFSFLNLSFLFLIIIYSYTHVFNNSSSSINNPTFSRFQNSYNYNNNSLIKSTEDCSGVHNFTDYNSKCLFVKSNSSCLGKGFINYLEIFYCSFGKFPALGYSLLFLWLIILFYLVGNTTAEYFVPSVEGLSIALKLSPTISGTTLLPLGNGANDVFASIISFTKSNDGDVGFNSVLGGVFFISCFVVGIVAITISSRQTTVNEASFVRDVLFLMFAILFLLMIIIFGRINLIIAISYVSLYFAYIGVVSAMHFFSPHEKENFTSPSPRTFSDHSFDEAGDDNIGIPLMGYVDEEKSGLPKTDSSEVSHQMPRIRKLFGFGEISCSHYLISILYVLKFPLYLPRRITIPVVDEEKWSKTFAVSSAILAPIMIVAVWGTQIKSISSRTTLSIYISAGLLGIILGNLAFAFTKISSPPKEINLLPWLAGGFLMSVTWTYLMVEELVSLLVSFGIILEISPSLLGFTVLAWGNSLGDLISNVTMAMNDNDGRRGIQIAMSGCYAGPLFNTLIGLGLSLVLASWNEFPSPYMIPKDPYLYEIVGFLIAGLLWALVILLKKNMKPDKSLGVGLLAIYLCFLFLRLAKALGFLNVDGSFISRLKRGGEINYFVGTFPLLND